MPEITWGLEVSKYRPTTSPGWTQTPGNLPLERYEAQGAAQMLPQPWKGHTTYFLQRDQKKGGALQGERATAGIISAGWGCSRGLVLLPIRLQKAWCGTGGVDGGSCSCFKGTANPAGRSVPSGLSIPEVKLSGGGLLAPGRLFFWGGEIAISVEVLASAPINFLPQPHLRPRWEGKSRPVLSLVVFATLNMRAGFGKKPCFSFFLS